MASRADQLVRMADSIRRYTKVRTYFGKVPIPTGNRGMLVFHLSIKQDKYILLNAQTSLLDGRIDYEEVVQVANTVAKFYREGRLWRELLFWYTGVSSYILIVLTFLLLLFLIVFLSQNQVSFFWQSVVVYAVAMSVATSFIYYR